MSVSISTSPQNVRLFNTDLMISLSMPHGSGLKWRIYTDYINMNIYIFIYLFIYLFIYSIYDLEAIWQKQLTSRI